MKFPGDCDISPPPRRRHLRRRLTTTTTTLPTPASVHLRRRGDGLRGRGADDPHHLPEHVPRAGRPDRHADDGRHQRQRGVDARLVYEPGTTVDLLYPGTASTLTAPSTTCPAGSSPTTASGSVIPHDEFLRDGINLTYTVNPTATAFVTYPPESAPAPTPTARSRRAVTPPPPGTPTTTVNPPTFTTGLPVTGTNGLTPITALGGLAIALGGLVLALRRKMSSTPF